MSSFIPDAKARLLQPIQVGNVQLLHRMVLAPLTRTRADSAYVPSEYAVEYYSQRASTPGTLLITEATYIALRALAYPSIPGVWSDEQIVGWKKVAQAVHAKKSFIFMQIWATGRAASVETLKSSEDPSLPYVSASDIPLSGYPTPPRPLTIPEIKEYVQLFADAAVNAVQKAGFDGVEIHGANGYLIDQFIQDVSNVRTDEYGGSIENRSRFCLEVVAAVVNAIGAERTGIRFSPWSKFQDMRMEDPIPTFAYLVTQLRNLYPNLAYIHVVEPRISGSADESAETPSTESNEFIREIWAPRPLITAGGYNTVEKIVAAAEKGSLVALGRYFISNPDLPERIQRGFKWTPYDRNKFYAKGSDGYTDYPFYNENQPQEGAVQASG